MLTVGRVGAGTGCRYLSGQVATGRNDFAPLSPAQALTYYSDVAAHGEPAGRWLGRGLPTLGLAGRVQPGELDNLIGRARHPHFDDLLRGHALTLLNDRSVTAEQRQAALAAAERGLYLGRGFATYQSAADRADRAVADLGDDADEASRDAVRAAVLADGDRQAVAAYELTFTPVKSVSVLAVLGGPGSWEQVLDAHRAAVDTALDYVQDHAAYSRTGVNGIRQVDTRGLVIAAFEHRMSRAGDPNIHSHAIIANRVQCADGAWRTVDGRAVYAASVGARAVYEQALEVELSRRLGVLFSTAERARIREIHGIPLPVIELFSKRRADIQAALAGAATGDDPDADRDPLSAARWRRRARRFTLSTRAPKTGAESTADAISRWHTELRRAGHDPGRLLAAAARPAVAADPERSDAEIIADAVQVLNQTRAVWTRHHAVLAVARVLPPPPHLDYATHRDRVERLVDQLLAGSVPLSPPETLTYGPTLRRDSDRAGVFTEHATTRYATHATADSEQRILDALTDTAAPAIPATQLAPVLARYPLSDDQDTAVHRALTTSARVVAIRGPAGSGKTYVQRAIVAAWQQHHTTATADATAGSADADATTRARTDRGVGSREVLALAPSQIAAAVLADSIGARAENVTKWLYEHHRHTSRAARGATTRRRHSPDPAWTLHPGQLVIIDEAGMLTTRELDAVLTAVRRADAKLLLVGDDHQLGAVGAGGLLATIADRSHAPTLTTVRRFRDPDGTLRGWECAASLGLRDRDLAAVAEYERRGRIHAGPLDRMRDTSYRAWLTDHLTFQPTPATGGPRPVALLMADTDTAAADLSARARADLVARGLVEPGGVTLADGNRAGVGDLIVTRLNERRLRAPTGDGFVANRDTWQVTGRDPDGTLTVTSLTTTHTPDPRFGGGRGSDEGVGGAGGTAAGAGGVRVLRLPAGYVADNVQLAYAGTVHSAQGRTVTTARGLVTEATTAQALYVMMSRGQQSNHAYIVTGDPDREPHQQLPAPHHLAVLAGILHRDDEPSASVTDTARDLADQAASIARLRVIFADLSTAVRGPAYQQLIADHAGPDTAHRAVADPAWASLVRALGAAQTAGWDSRQLLIQALTQRELGTAADTAAVLHWRCTAITGTDDITGTDPAGTPTAGPAPTWAERAAGIIHAARGDTLHQPVSADAADALTHTATALDARADTLAHRLAEAAEAGQAGGYDHGTTPTWLRALGPVPTSGRDRAARRAVWLDQARAVATYQDATGYQPPDQAGDPAADPIGPCPPLGDPEARQLWAAARRALADAPAAATIRALRSDRLHAWVTDGLTAETVQQPDYVGHELRTLSLRARAQHSRVHRLRHEQATAARQLAAADRRRWRRDPATVVRLTHAHQQAADRLTRAETTLTGIQTQLRTVTGLHHTWQDWDTATRDTRTRARLAAQELALRSHHYPTPPVAALRAAVSCPAGPNPLAPGMDTRQAALSDTQLAQQYAIQAVAADWFHSHLHDRWAGRYLASRGLTQPAAAARAGYAPSRPGHWTLLLDHLRRLGYPDTAIRTAGLAAPSRQGQLIDRFRDRVIIPVLDHADRPIGFLARKPDIDTDPDNPKYLNPTRTPLYDKSQVLYGLDADAVRELRAGARPIIVEGPMDRLAVRAAAPDLVPLATCGTALTDAHLDQLAQHTRLDRIILGFDADPAGRNAALAAGQKLTHRGIPPPDIDLYTPPDGRDPADLLTAHGPDQLAATLNDPHRRASLLDLLIDRHLDHYDTPTSSRPLRELPVAAHVAYETTRILADGWRTRLPQPGDLPQLQQQLTRIAARTGTAHRDLNNYLLDLLIPTDERPAGPEQDTDPDTSARTAEHRHASDPRLEHATHPEPDADANAVGIDVGIDANP